MDEQKERRTNELLGKKTLSNAEMEEYRSLKPGAFRKAPNLFDLGVSDLGKAAKNLSELSTRSKKVYEAGCYLEAISLRLLQLDFLLRILVKTRGEKIEAFDDKPFGKILELAKKAGLESSLATRLDSFNRIRIQGVHRFALGDVSYDELRKAFDEDPALLEDLERSVIGVLPLWT